jgi:hypothetical protein
VVSSVEIGRGEWIVVEHYSLRNDAGLILGLDTTVGELRRAVYVADHGLVFADVTA